jgi:hypothetical protein
VRESLRKNIVYLEGAGAFERELRRAREQERLRQREEKRAENNNDFAMFPDEWVEEQPATPAPPSNNAFAMFDDDFDLTGASTPQSPSDEGFVLQSTPPPANFTSSSSSSASASSPSSSSPLPSYAAAAAAGADFAVFGSDLDETGWVNPLQAELAQASAEREAYEREKDQAVAKRAALREDLRMGRVVYVRGRRALLKGLEWPHVYFAWTHRRATDTPMATLEYQETRRQLGHELDWFKHRNFVYDAHMFEVAQPEAANAEPALRPGQTKASILDFDF